MILSIAVVCEKDLDMFTARDLADRVLVETIDWLDEEHLPDLRRWRGLGPQESCLLWTTVDKEAKARGIRIRGGFEAEESHQFDSRTARRALILLSEIEPTPNAVVLIRDGDKQSEDRYPSLVNARNHAENDYLEGTPIVIGFAHPMKECWILAGFQPRPDSKEEPDRLAALRQELGFDPTRHPERLTASDKNAKKSPKRVLEVLCGGDRNREQLCWKETHLNVLKARGKETGLPEYLEEVKKRLVPLFEGRERSA